MPIIYDKKPIDVRELHELKAKRAKRDSLRNKYTLIRKEQKPSDYRHIRLIIGEDEYDISDSSKFLLDHLIAGSIKKQEI